jgi:hypothetical protein
MIQTYEQVFCIQMMSRGVGFQLDKKRNGTVGGTFGMETTLSAEPVCQMELLGERPTKNISYLISMQQSSQAYEKPSKEEETCLLPLIGVKTLNTSCHNVN